MIDKERLRIGENIRKIRESKDISQNALARSISITDARLSKIERGIAPLPVDIFIRLANELETDPADILGVNLNTDNMDSLLYKVEVPKALVVCYRQQVEILKDQIDHLRGQLYEYSRVLIKDYMGDQSQGSGAKS